MANLYSLACTAAMMGRKYNLRVTAQPGGAYTRQDTQGWVVNVPPVVEAEADAADTLINGYLDHEAGHVRFSDMTAVGSVASDPLMRGLLNIYEDVRIERLMSETFPGCAINLHRLSTYIFRDKPQTENLEGEVATCHAVLLHARHTINDSLPLPDIDPALQALAAQADKTQTTQDALALARQTYDLIRKDTQQNGQSGQGEGQDESVSERSDERGSGRQDGQGESISGQQGEAQKRKRGQKAQKTQSGQLTQEQADELDIGTLSAKEMSDAAVSAESELIRGGLNENSHARMTSRIDPQLAQEARMGAAQLEAQLRMLAQTLTLNRGGAARRGKLDPHKLYRLVQGSDRIFTRRVDKIGIDSDVILLADASGSMQGIDSVLESKAIYALRAAMQGIQGLTCSAYAFGSCTLAPMAPDDAITNPCGGTPGTEALTQVLPHFRADARKKTLIVITDGAVNDSDTFRAVREDAERHGITCIGLLVSCLESSQEYMANIFPAGQWSHLRSFHELPAALFSLVKEQMV